MRVAAIYDIHGNLPALEAVLREVARERVDRIVVGGDVLPGPMPVESLAMLRVLDVPVSYVNGNGESAVLAVKAGAGRESLPEQAREVIPWTAEQIEHSTAEWIATWPLTMRLDIPGLGAVLFCHATPRNNTEIFTYRTRDEHLLPVFRGVDASLVVCGHTHMPFDRRVGQTRVVNAGSVGMPFGPAGADWLLLGPDVQPRRTSYDLPAAAARVRMTPYPQAEQFASRNILSPPTEAEMLEIFARAELSR
jgi:predicted phosphodiesterase